MIATFLCTPWRYGTAAVSLCAALLRCGLCRVHAELQFPMEQQVTSLLYNCMACCPLPRPATASQTLRTGSHCLHEEKQLLACTGT